MNRQGYRNPEATHLRAAWENWQQLHQAAMRFLKLPAVARALVDDEYRLTDFAKSWTQRPQGTGAGSFKESKGFQSYIDVARAYCTAANHTQKLLDHEGVAAGMRSMTAIMEQMNILIDGETLHSEYQLVEFVPNSTPSIEGLRIHAVLALKVLLSGSRGRLDSRYTPNLVTESHGLHVIVSHSDMDIHKRIPHINQIASTDMLESPSGYGYGGADAEKTWKRVQGARFRAKQLREEAEERLPEFMNEHAWERPLGSKGTLIMADVCTAEALSHMRPTFFERRWGIGVKASKGESVDFRREDIRGQLLRAIPHIAETILHYPEDNPLIQSER